MAMYTPVGVPGGFRYMIEKMNPADYLAASYYEKWMHARTQGLLEKGIFTQQELEAKIKYFAEHQDEQHPVVQDAEKLERALQSLVKQQPPDPAQPNSPKFKTGDMIRAKNMHPVGHTRLPRYCRGKLGVVDHYYDYWWVDDTPPAGEEHAICLLYTSPSPRDGLLSRMPSSA